MITNIGNSNTAKDIKEVIENAINGNRNGTLVNISIDNLAVIMSGHGGEFANKMVDDLIEDLSTLLKEEDYCLRVGMDHIYIILYDSLKKTSTEKIEKIYKYIQDYGCIKSDKPLQIISTIGSANFSEAKTADDVINHAYIALHDAREKYVHYVDYKDELKHIKDSKSQMLIASYIQNAFLKNKLCFAYQPIIDRTTLKASYYECLLRVINNDGSLSSIGPFIPLAEKMGFVSSIDGLVLQMVVEDLTENPDAKLAINLSNATIHDSKWLTMAKKLLKQNKEIANRLIIEITETARQLDINKTHSFIEDLRRLGCQVALDDFGTGFTSFSQIRDLPVDIIKIDGSFVKNITSSEENKFFVKTLVEFGINFGLKSVAEYVENEEIANTLTMLNVDYMQGHYFSKPLERIDWIEYREKHK